MSATDGGQQVNRGLLIALGVVAALALLWLFVLDPLVLGTEGDDAAPPAPVAAPTGSADEGLLAEGEPEAQEEAEAALAELPVETYEVFLARDPFEPVFPAAAPGDDGTDGDGAPGDDTDDGTTDPTPSEQGRVQLIDIFVDEGGAERAILRVDDVVWLVGEQEMFGPDLEFQVLTIDGSCATVEGDEGSFTLCEGGTQQPGGGDDVCTGGDGEAVCDGRVVSLVDVFEEDGQAVAVVQVQEQLYEVRVGETFAENFEVLSIDPPCVTLLYGDDTFSLCEGERVLK